MIVVKLLKDCPLHSGFAGEVMAFADEVAAKLIATGKAAKHEAEPELVEMIPVADDAPAMIEIGRVTAADPEPEFADDGQPEVDEPAPRRRGRPRKSAD